MSIAYAVRMSPQNLDAIASEKPDFNLEETLDWIEEHGEGYFVRDPDTPGFDCAYFEEDVFETIYEFLYAEGSSALFRRIKQR